MTSPIIAALRKHFRAALRSLGWPRPISYDTPSRRIDLALPRSFCHFSTASSSVQTTSFFVPMSHAVRHAARSDLSFARLQPAYCSASRDDASNPSSWVSSDWPPKSQTAFPSFSFFFGAMWAGGPTRGVGHADNPAFRAIPTLGAASRAGGSPLC